MATCMARANTGESEVSGESVLICDLDGDAQGRHEGHHHDPERGEWGKVIGFPSADPLAGTQPENLADLP